MFTDFKISIFVPLINIWLMANEELLISGIGYKARRLVEHNQLLKAENEKLKSVLHAQEESLERIQDQLNKKNNEFLKLSLASALENRNGVERGIQMIDRMIEEIDRSIDVISE